MWNVLNRMENHALDNSDFQFLSYRPPKSSYLFGHKQIFSFKSVQIYREDEIDLTMIFCRNDFFCAILSFRDIVTFSNYCVQILQGFRSFKTKEKESAITLQEYMILQNES